MSKRIAIRSADEALANVGVVENGENRGVAIETYQQACNPPLPPGSPWCMAFVVYRFRNSAHDLNASIRADWSRSGYCPHHYRWAIDNGYFVPYLEASVNPTLVKKGYIALFYNRELGRIAHTGIVVEVHQWGVVTVEGNTSAPPKSRDLVDREGDGVYKKSRGWSALGLYGGFVNTYDLEVADIV